MRVAAAVVGLGVVGGVAPLRFFMYTDHALDMSRLTQCPGFQQLLESQHGEALQEVHVHAALRAHPQRTMVASEATAFYVPIMEYLSWRMHRCLGETHEERMLRAFRALRSSAYYLRSHGADHFWASSKSLAYGPVDMSGTPYVNYTLPIGLKARMRPLSKILRETTVGRMKPFGLRSAQRASAVGACTFDLGYSPNQEALRLYRPGGVRRILVYFAGSLDVCCGGRLIRCRLGALLPEVDADPTVLLVPSHGPRKNAGQCTKEALQALALKRNASVDAIGAEFARTAMGETGNRYVAMARYMAESTFCLAPAGDTCTSSRVYSAIAAGCIPVVLCDGFLPAFNNSVDYSGFIIKFPTEPFLRDPRQLLRYLRDIAPATVARMQQALHDHRADVLLQLDDGRRAGTHVLAEAQACFDRLARRRPRAGRGHLDSAVALRVTRRTVWGPTHGRPPRHELPPQEATRYLLDEPHIDEGTPRSRNR